MRAHGMQCMDRVAEPDDHEVVDPGPHLAWRRLRQGGEVRHVPGLEPDPFRAGTAEGVAADHVAQGEDDVAADIRAGGHDQQTDDEEHGRSRPLSAAAVPEDERHSGQGARNDHERAMDGRPRPCAPIGVRVVGQSCERRGQKRDLAHHHREERGLALTGDIEHKRDREGSDRDIRDGRMERMPEPCAVEQILDRSDRLEQRAEPAVIEVAEGLRPAILPRDEPGKERPHDVASGGYLWVSATDGPSMATPSRDGCPQTVHIDGKVGDNLVAIRRAFVDKAIVAAYPRRLHFVLPEGAVRTARPARRVIDGTGPGARFEGRKASERGTREARRDSGLVRSRVESTGRSSHSSFGRFRVRCRSSCARSAPAKRPRPCHTAAPLPHSRARGASAAPICGRAPATQPGSLLAIAPGHERKP